MDTPDNIYYDITLTNSISLTSIQASYNETRSIPIIKDTTDYYLSIIRFSLDTTTLPVFCPSIQINQSDVNLTNYSITLQYVDSQTNQTFEYQQYISYIPQDKSASIPGSPSVNAPYFMQDNSTGYYNVYNYQYFIYLINNAFTSCFNQLQTIVTNNNLTLPTNIPPNMSFDLSLLVASINITSDYYSSSNGVINIFFNQQLYELFSSLPATILGINSSNGKYVQIMNNYAGITTTITQEYSTVASWNPVMSIVFTTQQLPVISNLIGAPMVYNNGRVLPNNSNNVISNIMNQHGAMAVYILNRIVYMLFVFVL
jgi:hypothetical protein